MSSKIYFVGIGGSGGMVATQKLSTAGTMLLANGSSFYIDPGPGAVLRSRQLGLKLEKLDAILVTHRHLDHCGDLAAMIEASYNLSDPANTPGRKWLFAPGDYFKEYPLLSFMQVKIKKNVLVKPGQVYAINGISITTTQALIEKPKYDDDLPELYGYWFKAAGVDIGFWPQSQYRSGITAGFCPKILVMDFWSTASKPWEDQIQIIRSIQPIKIILRHFDLTILREGLDTIAQNMQQETGIETIIAPEGGSLEI